MSVARAREFIARCRAAGIVVHELGGYESRGNGQTSAYQGFSIHHTATAFGMAPRVLWEGRSDLGPPLCNSAGNVDGSITVVAAHPANHAGASGGWDTAPLPRTSVFNKLMWGHEIVYPGTVHMTAAQYRTALIVSKIGVDIWGYGDVNRIKFHEGTSITGKWDPGYASGRTYSIQEFRAAAAAGPEDDMALADDRIPMWFGNVPADKAIGTILGSVAGLAGTKLRDSDIPEQNYPQWVKDLRADVAAMRATVAGLSDDEAKILAAIRAQPTGAQVDVQQLAVFLAPLIPAGATPEQVQEAVRLVFARAGAQEGNPA